MSGRALATTAVVAALALGTATSAAGAASVASHGWEQGQPERALVYAEVRDNRGGLVLEDLADGRRVRLTEGGAAGWDAQPAWSPNGQAVAFVRRDPAASRLMVYDPVTGEERSLTGTGLGLNVNYPAWSPAGDRLVFSAQGELFTVRADGGELHRLTDAPGDEVDAAWAPGGDQIVFTRLAGETSDSPTGSSDLYVVALDDAGGPGAERRVTRSGRARSGRWSPLGTAIAYNDGVSIRVLDPATADPAAADPAAADPANSDADADADARSDVLVALGEHGPAWSPDGSLLAYSADSSGDPSGQESSDTLFVVEAPTVEGPTVEAPTGEAPRAVARDPGATLTDPQWSAAGDRIVASATRPRGDRLDSSLLVVAFPDGRTTTIASAGHHLRDPRPSPGLAGRVAGPTRLDTAVAVSRTVFTAADAVVVARADDYADALAGAPLAGVLGAPVLLSPTDGLPESVAAEVRRLGATTAYVLGGDAALSSGVEEGLRAAGVGDVRRVAGGSRYATAARIADLLPDDPGGGDGVVYLVEGASSEPGRGWPDAVAVSGLATRLGRPILLTERDRLPAETRERLAAGATGVVVVGGTAAISAGTLEEVAGVVPATGRLGGATRYETSSLLAQAAQSEGLSVSTVWLASGRDWPDALAAAPATAPSDGLLLLVEPTVGREQLGWLADNRDRVRQVQLVGGPDVLPPAVEASVEGLLSSS